jgi:hypothetical protein
MSESERQPVFILSLDYELFFGKSGSYEECLFEPCSLVDDFCRKHAIKVTYFVDAGMLVRLRELADSDNALGRAYDAVRRHVQSLANQGHEIGLHVHPHWEDTRWRNGEWDFSGTRYRLDQFDPSEAHRIVVDYAAELQELMTQPLESYRAGGFCIEPFDILRDALLEVGITVDSSVVPGASLLDEEKGFDFSVAPDRSAWTFDGSPLQPAPAGGFVEVPITPLRLPFLHYWGRLADRLLPRPSTAGATAGRSKAIGRREILRRLSGRSNISELSIDHAKAEHLPRSAETKRSRTVWHTMGHPKLIRKESLSALEAFLGDSAGWTCQSVGEFGQLLLSS